MDRSPSQRTTTDRPDRISSSSDSSAFGSDVDEIINRFSDHSREYMGDAFTKYATGSNSCISPRTAGGDSNYGSPPPNSKAPAMPSYRTETAVIPPKTPRVKGACHDNDVKEVEPPTATQQLQKVRQMFRRLDSHNDGMEEALIGLRSRIDTFRSLLATCLNGTVKELRGELRILRESTQFLVQDFSGDLEQCRRIIMRRLQGEANRRGYDPPPTRSFKKDYSMEGGLSKCESSWELQQQCGAGRGEQSVFPGWRELEVREDLLEAQQRCTALEKKLKQQREAHENHLSAMKDMYESKEYTLKRRVELLERLVERDSEKLRYILSDDSKDGHGKWGKRGHFKEEQDNYYSSGDDDCDEVRESSRLHTRSKQSLKAPAQKLLKKRRGGLVKEHESHQSQHPRQGPSDSWTPMLYDDVERRVRAQLLYGRQNSPNRPKGGGSGRDVGGPQKGGECRNRLEERRLENVARRLLNAVGEAKAKQKWPQAGDEADHRRVGPWRTSNDVSTVARGLWAENVLQKRAARQL
ncbi:hypothetical protein, conserved [Trypanosoma brucei gambiense DAL972]|uniref:Uncharacterized protein n=1 Tax=Trypanosoma brucei gambiense (strain MHOM/CI/86/DAL972) TaxID=679716 RepID=C9ZJW4_TRYB9|nr:hypothetical protein, conserved [Trypanosoma brucei gambiense DAL972]CBH09728.1 hypothetical protein, conserved [Trypanosoma brucei gambiense DAL972]|eukprot:XP_011772021.1 hypothetical protein, conserved [Trypanosoma brucei gambiense DAL972]